ncbi:Os02g0299950 [Oryza sativa Japonica Group]|jgi:hypothetical protein|nr:Os02g0299950 [Oryza sativa Japonica Group]
MLHIAQPRRASSSPARITPSLAKGADSVELVADPLFSLAKGAGLPSSSALTPTIQSRQIVHLACCYCSSTHTMLLYIEHFETQHEGAEVVDESSNKSLRPNCLLLPPPCAELLLPSAIDRFRRRLRAARSCTFSVPPPLPANAAADSG